MPEKVFPHDIEAEQCAIAAAMFDTVPATIVTNILQDSDFFREPHRHILQAVEKVLRAGQPIDIYIVKDELAKMGQLERVTFEYLMSCMSVLPSASRAEHYAKIVLDKSLLRQRIAINAKITEMAMNGATSEEVEATATEETMKLMRRGGQKGPIPLQEAMGNALLRIQERANREDKIQGPRFGLSNVDNVTVGLDPGFTIIAAATGIGKTSLMLHIPKASLPLRGVMFEFEMMAEQLAERMIVSRARLDSQEVRRGMVDDVDFQKLTHAANDLWDVPLFIDEEAKDARQILSAVQRAILEHKVDYVLVDYIGLIDSGEGKRSESRNLELGSIARGLQQIGQKAKVPVVVACQLSRKWQSRKNGRPELQDLRDSGELEQHADRVIFIHRPPENEPDEATQLLDVEIDVAKNRHGATSIEHVKWHGPTFKFSEVETHYEYDGPPAHHEPRQFNAFDEE